MGSLPSVCGSDTAAVDPRAQPHHYRQPRQRPIQARESYDILAGRPPPPPYSRSQPSTNRGDVENPYDSYRDGYPQRPPGFKPAEPPPPYTSPLHSNRIPAQPLAAVTARSSVINDPGDLWLYSEQPPSPIDNSGEAVLENGDDVEDFATHPDGQLVITSDKDYEIPASCLNIDGLFEDPDFPAEPESIYSDGSRDTSNITWMRPHEIRQNPCLVVDGFSRQDVVQGNIGDCWFLAALSAVAKMPALIQKIVPSGQNFKDDYTGMFRFRFWRFGRWISVVVDDRLPVKHNKRVFARSSDFNEFWPSLVEKAYAKLHGSYSGLSGGMAADAFVDLTGGLAEVYDLTTDDPDEVYGILYRGTRSGAFMCCSRKFETDETAVRFNSTNPIWFPLAMFYDCSASRCENLNGMRRVDAASEGKDAGSNRRHAERGREQRGLTV
nr:calpain-B-like [Lytechinus pictus]